MLQPDFLLLVLMYLHVFMYIACIYVYCMYLCILLYCAIVLLKMLLYLCNFVHEIVSRVHNREESVCCGVLLTSEYSVKEVLLNKDLFAFKEFAPRN